MSVKSSLSFSDCSSDLLCGESAATLEEDSSLFVSPDLELPVEESIMRFVKEERDYMPGLDYQTRFGSQELDSSAREESIAWILKVHAFYHFQPLTAYLSVNYMDRFLSSRRFPQAKGRGWPLQLLSVACLSLAAKMEEPLVHSLMDLQVEGAKFMFEAKTIRRMELLVLSTLDWRLRSTTPFNFLTFFAYKVDPTATFIALLVSHATHIILTTLREIKFLGYSPSSMAAAAILCAAHKVSNLSVVVANPGSAGSWCDGLNKDMIMSCYRLMQQLVIEHSGQRKTIPRVLPKLRVTTLSRISSGSSTSSPSSKRRKLNSYSWIKAEAKKNP